MKVKMTFNPKQKISAIKAYRFLSGLGLKDSKDYIESLYSLTGIVNSLSCIVETTLYPDDILREKANNTHCYASDFVQMDIVEDNIPATKKGGGKTFEFNIIIRNGVSEININGVNVDAKMSVPHDRTMDVINFFKDIYFTECS
jgi:hypothetical protein